MWNYCKLRCFTTSRSSTVLSTPWCTSALQKSSSFICEHDQSDQIPRPNMSFWNEPWAPGTCLSPSCGKLCWGETVWREPRWPGGSNCDRRLPTQLWVSLHRDRQGDGDRGLFQKTLMIQRQRKQGRDEEREKKINWLLLEAPVFVPSKHYSSDVMSSLPEA